jgi:hypothetical protein
MMEEVSVVPEVSFTATIERGKCRKDMCGNLWGSQM